MLEMGGDIDGRIQAVFQNAIRGFDHHLTDATRRGELEGWDSLGHLMVVEGLMEEFGVDIRPEQALDLETVGDIKRLLGELAGT